MSITRHLIGEIKGKGIVGDEVDDDCRVDTGDDDRISKEEFTSDGLKSAMEKVI